ncbi:alkaline phosphatase, tissue-nonspecific isozyme-like [Gigantopelta aegis]|uniref:alkaline phosphatase, tissue-nonspecific isozyme-like n=1 Tax=Gigantopelta aegis TaxID=1735272 RepID=UPI001B8885A9|nr:alkaline phosphatase, tissue-nonspecific isozyme-like [Gigantopelta aegis]
MLTLMLYAVVAASVVCLTGANPFPKTRDDRDPSYWNTEADQELQDAIKLQKTLGVARNVILFLGDGMGIPSITTARILHGQMNQHSGEESTIAFDNFPHVALSRTYSVDHQTPDSAGTATAFLTGVKTNSYMIGQNAYTQKGNCSSAAGNELLTILDWSLAKGKSTGVVTTTRITHATPGASYAHSAHRDWEGDSMMVNETGHCVDIAKQLVFNNSDIQEWIDKQKEKGRKYKYVWNHTEFDNIDPSSTDYVLGLFNQDHMQYELDRKLDKAGEPSLAQMTAKAIQVLKKNANGFFMLVEGGRIDHGHHNSEAVYAIHDTVAFADAVAKAVEMTSQTDTLIIVTADHSHTFSFGGYPSRGNPIFGVVDNALDNNNHTFTTLAYANGPGYSTQHNANLTNDVVENKTYHQSAGVPLSYETHGGEDVAIYARGPMSHLFHGVHQQNYIAHVMAFASCVGEYADDKKCVKSLVPPTSGVSRERVTAWWLLTVVVVCLLSRPF